MPLHVSYSVTKIRLEDSRESPEIKGFVARRCGLRNQNPNLHGRLLLRPHYTNDRAVERDTAGSIEVHGCALVCVAGYTGSV